MITTSKLNNLDPLHRIEFDAEPVLQWRVTWPDGTSEIIEGHFMQPRDEMLWFHYYYLGAHRCINPRHARDIEELDIAG